MATSLWYTSLDSGRVSAYVAQAIQDAKHKRRRIQHMAPSETGTGEAKPTAPETKTVQNTVFDLTSFSDVTLVKTYNVPAKPATQTEALAAIGNDEKKLIEAVAEYLDTLARNAAANDPTGWLVKSDDPDVEPVPYNGKFADEETGKRINAGILGFAKMLGYEKSLPKERKAELKATALSAIRSNPDVIKTFGIPASVTVPVEPTA